MAFSVPSAVFMSTIPHIIFYEVALLMVLPSGGWRFSLEMSTEAIMADLKTQKIWQCGVGWLQLSVLLVGVPHNGLMEACLSTRCIIDSLVPMGVNPCLTLRFR